MTKYIVNNIEQVQPDGVDGTLIKLHSRDADGNYECITVHGFRPHFYALESEVKDQEDWLLTQDSIDGIDYGDYQAFNRDENLAKIYVPYPQDTRDARDLFDEHFAADVPFTRRFRIDTGIRDVFEAPSTDVHWTEISPVEGTSGGSNPGGNASKTTFQDVAPRVVTVDIEADDSNGFPDPRRDDILSIVAHDSYTDEYHAWIFTESQDIFSWAGVERPSDVNEEGLGALGLDDKLDRGSLHLQPTQNHLLSSFADYIDDVNPDIITGWYSNDFDIPYIRDRMEAVGAPMSKVARDGWFGESRGEPRIKGRTCYDLMEIYDANHHTELTSYSLDDVARNELGKEKLEFEGSYYDLWQDDPITFLRYNIRDVELTVGINREAKVIEFRDALRRKVGVDFEDSYDNKDFVDMMVRRKLKEWGQIPPSRPDYGDAPESDFEGGYVFDAPKGISDNVAAMDLASLYPYTMAMLNASPETKLDEFTEQPSGSVEAANGVSFSKNKQGLFPSLVDDAIDLKSEYKQQLHEADEEEREFWEIQYGTAKTITNSLYGVTGWARFFLYDEEVAEAVTLTAQEVAKRTAEYAEESGYPVLYGDTDSVYVLMPDDASLESTVALGRELQEDLNEYVYPELATRFGIHAEDNLWEIELEAIMSTYFQAGKKKRYAYVAVWKDGKKVEEPEPTIVGFEDRRSDTAEITGQLQRNVFREILLGNIDNINDLVFRAAQEITADEPDLERIGIPGGLQQEIDPQHEGEDGYYAFSASGNYPQDAQPRGAWNANKLAGTSFGEGDKPKRVYLEPTHFEQLGREINVICFGSPGDIEELRPLNIDTNRMIETTIIKPMDRILSVIDVDVEAAVRGQVQMGLGAF